MATFTYAEADKELAHRGPNPEFEGIPRWEMQNQYPHLCIHCRADYRGHWPWPDLPCRKFIELRQDALKAESIIYMNT